ncbi:MAG: PqqD family protein [Fimbriimonadales bacterium]
MGLARILSSTFDRRRRLEPEELRKAVPMANPAVRVVDESESGLILEAPLQVSTNRWIAGMARILKQPDRKRFELEPVGAFVWKSIDGRTSFEGISRKLREQYRMSRVEADAALGAFLQLLAQRRLITLWIRGPHPSKRRS